jgi:hypothetical protein
VDAVNGHDAEPDAVDEVHAAVDQLVTEVQGMVPAGDDRPQVTYPNFKMDLLDQAHCPPGQRILVIETSKVILLFPMEIENAQKIGGLLAAPSVVKATAAEAKAAARAMGMPR